MKKEKLEAIEVRIDMLRQDSRLISYRISALEERRHEIQERIKKLKQRAKRAR
jgi:chaperonin cofactor prefoldin